MNIQEMELDVFLARNNITAEDFEKCSLDWELIQSIGADHQSKISNLEDLAESYAKTIQRFNKVHSVRWRIKNPEHLMEKIVRKATPRSGSYNKDYLKISVNNYFEMVTDLIGIRALHLFKQDCVSIINELENTWEKSEAITAYIRKGDSEDDYKEMVGWEVKEHKAGYRSIHFVFSTAPYKSKVFTEVQIRTIFEEGWSEIDHKIRYPNFSDNEDIAAFLNIFNRLAGSADEMGSFVKALSNMIKCNEDEIKELKVKQQVNDEKIEGLLNKLAHENTQAARDIIKTELSEQIKKSFQFKFTNKKIGNELCKTLYSDSYKNLIRPYKLLHLKNVLDDDENE